MKKKLVVMLAALTALSAVGCGVTTGGSSSSSSSDAAATSEAATSEATSEAATTEAEASGESFYAGKTVQMIVPWKAGGGADTAVRLACKYIEQELDCTIVVNNVTGGGGSIGLNQMLDSAADGLTLAYVANTDSNGATMLEGVTYTVDSFAPVAQFAADPHVLAVSNKSGITDMDGVIAAGDGSTTWGIGGAWTNWDFLKLEFEAATNTSYKRIAYDGGASVINAMMSGDESIGTPLVSEALSAIDAGEIVPIAVSGADRVDSLPDVPTIAECLGTDFESVMWRGFAAPAGTDEAVLREFAEAVGRACDNADFQADAATAGVTVSYKDYDEFQTFFAENDVAVRELYEANKDSVQ